MTNKKSEFTRFSQDLDARTAANLRFSEQRAVEAGQKHGNEDGGFYSYKNIVDQDGACVGEYAQFTHAAEAEANVFDEKSGKVIGIIGTGFAKKAPKF